MEILFISHKYPPTIGGMEKQSYELIQQAAQQATVHQLVHTGEDESKFFFFLKLRRRVKKILRKHPTIQMIHLNDGLMGLFCTWLKDYTDIPVVITFHGLDLVFPNAVYQKRISQRFIRYDGAICVSTATAKECIKRGFAKEKVFVVPNGVDHDIAQFQFDKTETIAYLLNEYGIDFSQQKIITLLGRPVKRKGFSWFLEKVATELDEDTYILMIGPLSKDKAKPFWKKIIPQKWADRIELVTGGVNDEAAIRNLLTQKKIKNRVVQTGKLPFEKLLACLSLSDLFVMPNIKMEGDAEGFGLVALEASLCKTVVLASGIEGIPEAIQDQKNGYLLPTDNAEFWIKTIKEKLQDPAELAKRGQEFQEFTLTNYSWEKMANGYLDIFKQLKKK